MHSMSNNIRNSVTRPSACCFTKKIQHPLVPSVTVGRKEGSLAGEVLCLVSGMLIDL